MGRIMGIFKSKTENNDDGKSDENSVLDLDRPFGLVKDKTWQDLPDDEKRSRGVSALNGIRSVPEYDLLIIETAKNWRAREYFVERNWPNWMFAFLVDAMLVMEVMRGAQAGLVDDIYQEEALSVMAKLYFYRLQNLNNVLEMLVVEIYYNILQNAENLKDFESLWVKFANF